eukprot:INCI1245.2.p2 GENE.INCI1245.2~~INCI1245.2.p2  ORF type:complete len:128 (-),score=1.63 INCI1245.2:111-494(-)
MTDGATCICRAAPGFRNFPPHAPRVSFHSNAALGLVSSLCSSSKPGTSPTALSRPQDAASPRPLVSLPAPPHQNLLLRTSRPSHSEVSKTKTNTKKQRTNNNVFVRSADNRRGLFQRPRVRRESREE